MNIPHPARKAEMACLDPYQLPGMESVLRYIRIRKIIACGQAELALDTTDSTVALSQMSQAVTLPYARRAIWLSIFLWERRQGAAIRSR